MPPPDVWRIRGGLSCAVVQYLEAVGQVGVTGFPSLGVCQLVARDPDTGIFTGMADWRKEGAAAAVGYSTGG